MLILIQGAGLVYSAYLRKQNNELQDFNVKAETKSIDGVTAVFVNGFSRDVLDSEFGAGIDFDIECSEWMADFRHSDFWCMPAFGESLSDVPNETQGLIYRKSDKSFGVILPVVSEKYKCVLCGNENGGLTAKLFSWATLSSCRALAFVTCEGDNPFTLLQKCAETALKLLGNGCRTRTERRYPEIFEYLGWCSWDAMEIRVCEEDLVRKCREFREKDIPVRWAIIDDMWAEVHDFYDAEYKDRPEMFQIMHGSKLFSFKADPKRFPNGLKACIDKMNGFGIKVGMWHPTTGYWMGIDTDGEIYKDLKDNLICCENGKCVHHYSTDKAFAFYNAFHEYLQNSGAEFIKIDNQSGIIPKCYKGMAPVGEIAREYHNAMEASVGMHFDNAMINCMGMASEDMWNRKVSPISRCSDDFLPENSAWFLKHIMQCSYNDLIQGQLYYCDWDMWWTDDGQAEKNSILRAVSGGPIYVSDKLDRSKREILMPLVLSDGKILRCDRPAMPSADCITQNPLSSGKVFKLQNICGECGVIAAFNIDSENKPVSGAVSPSDIDGIEGEEFAVYEHFSRELKILKKDESFDLKLKDGNDYRLFVVSPIRDGFAVIGRTDKFISPKTVKAIVGREILLAENGEYAVVEDGKLIVRQP